MKTPHRKKLKKHPYNVSKTIIVNKHFYLQLVSTELNKLINTTKYLKGNYRISSNTRPQRLLNFETVRWRLFQSYFFQNKNET